jgi:hypothetical protein
VKLTIAITLAFTLAAAYQPCDERASTVDDVAAPRVAPGPACERDRDCFLLPEIGCCGECAPAPPFEAVSAAELDALLLELEERCAQDTRECAPPRCRPVPARCEARARCVDGRCVVDAAGCRRPTS